MPRGTEHAPVATWPPQASAAQAPIRPAHLVRVEFDGRLMASFKRRDRGAIRVAVQDDSGRRNRVVLRHWVNRFDHYGLFRVPVLRFHPEDLPQLIQALQQTHAELRRLENFTTTAGPERLASTEERP